MKSTNPPADTDHVAAAASGEPVRWLAGYGGDWERRLLASAATDRVPASSLERLARALDMPRSALPAAARGGLGSLSPLAKGGSLAALGAVGLLVLVAVRLPSAPHEVTSATASQPALDVAARAAAEAVAPLAAPVPFVAPLPERAESPMPSRAAAPRTAKKPKIAREGLRAELRALEAVQRPMRAGKIETASAALDDYARRFPNGELSAEAERLGADIALARSERGDGVNEAVRHMKERR